MVSDPEKFVVLGVRWTYIQNRELGGGVTPRAPVCGSPREIDLRCLSCGHEWTARKGRRGDRRGNFEMTIGFVHLGCPSCNAEGVLPNASLDAERTHGAT